MGFLPDGRAGDLTGQTGAPKRTGRFEGPDAAATHLGAAALATPAKETRNSVSKLDTGNIAGKLYLLVAAAILPALLIILYSGLAQRDQAIEQTNRVLDNFTNGIADLQVEKSNEIKLFLQTIATLPAVRNLDAARCALLFEKLLRDNPGLANITLTDPRGIVLASGLPSPQERVDLSGRTGFRETVRTKAFSSGDFIVGLYAKVPVLPFGLPVLDDGGNLVGVLLCSHVLEKYQSYFKDIQLMPDSRLTFLDRNGVRLLGFSWQGEMPPVGTPIMAQNWRVIAESRSDTGHFTGMRYDGVEILFHFRKLRLSPGDPPYMVVFTNTPLSAVLAAPNRALRINLALLALAALSALIVARLLGQTLVARRFEALRQSEDRLRSSEQRLLDAQRIAQIGDWEHLPESGRTTWSDEVYRIAGRERGAAPGPSGQALLPFHPDDAPVHDRAVREALATGKPYDLELRVLRPGGQVAYALARGLAEKNDAGEVVRLYGTIQDINERKLAEEALRESEAFAQSIAAAARDAIVMIDPEGAVAFWNPAAESILGYSREEALGRDLHLLLAPQRYQAAYRAAFSAFRLTGQGDAVGHTRELTARRKDGKEIAVSLSLSALNIHGGWHAIGILRDITARKQDAELREHIERIIRHDLRTPAANAIGIARSLLEEDNLTEEQRRLLGLLEHSGHNMLDTLDSSLDLYKIETGQYRCEPVAFDCLSLVRDMIEVMAKWEQFAGIRLNLQENGRPGGPDLPCPCLGEPRLLRIALHNLLVNALEASPPGAAVAVALSSDQDCRIEIRNQGAVPREIRDRFFEKFVTQGKPKGTGIGTYSAKMMVKAQGGDIAMRTSEEANETVVTVRMPC